PPLAQQFLGGSLVQIVFGTEVTILQTNVEMRRNRITNAGNQLPGEVGVGPSEADDIDLVARAGGANATTDISVQAVVRAKVDKRVDHGGDGAAPAAVLKEVEERNVRVRALDPGLLIAE